MSDVLSLDEARARRRAASADALGPYETAYDVRHGYEAPARPRPRPAADQDEVFLFHTRGGTDDERR
jgi:hypothetical protein